MKTALVVLLGLASLTAQTSAAQTPSDPRKEGPYPVGVTTTVVIDSERTDRLTNKPRTLLTEIWYPASDKARTMPKNHYRDFFPGGFTPELSALLLSIYRSSAEDLDKAFWNNSVRDAPVREGRFPLVIFSHGNGGTRNQKYLLVRLPGESRIYCDRLRRAVPYRSCGLSRWSSGPPSAVRRS